MTRETQAPTHQNHSAHIDLIIESETTVSITDIT